MGCGEWEREADCGSMVLGETVARIRTGWVERVGDGPLSQSPRPPRPTTHNALTCHAVR